MRLKTSFDDPRPLAQMPVFHPEKRERPPFNGDVGKGEGLRPWLHSVAPAGAGRIQSAKLVTHPGLSAARSTAMRHYFPMQ